MVKFLLWQRGGWKIHLSGADAYVDRLQEYYRTNEFGKFDDDVIGVRPSLARGGSVLCRIARGKFSGASDWPALGWLPHWLRPRRDCKAAAVIDGEVKFSEEIGSVL